MRGTATRVWRKIQSDGHLSTLRSIWKEIYLIEFLTYTPKVRNYLYRTIAPTEVDRREHTVADLSTDGRVGIQIPDKIWINGDLPVEEAPTYHIPAPKLYVYDSCRVFTPPGIGVTSNGDVISDTVASELAWQRNRNRTFISRLIYEHGLRTTHKSISDPDSITQFDFDKLLPVYPFWSNYFHWTAECLPKLLWLDKTDEVASEDVTIGIPSDPPGWMTESLALIGIDAYCELNDGIHTAKELIVPSGPEPSPEECDWFRDQALSGLRVDETSSNRIYVSREQANRRRLDNRDEIMEVLSEYGFESYMLENLSVKEQATLFANTEVVVGPHGAGFTNLMYSRDSAVIELFGSRKKLTYYRLAKLLGFEYHAVTGKEVAPDIRVDPTAVREVVERVLE